MRHTGTFVFTVWPLHYNKRFQQRCIEKHWSLSGKNNFYGCYESITEYLWCSCLLLNLQFKIGQLFICTVRLIWITPLIRATILALKSKLTALFLIFTKRRQLWNVSFIISKNIFKGSSKCIKCAVLLDFVISIVSFVHAMCPIKIPTLHVQTDCPKTTLNNLSAKNNNRS